MQGKMHLWWLGCAVAALGAVCSAAESTSEEDLLRQQRLIGNIITSTTTVLTITTVSTEVPVSCLVNTLPTVACTGRRRRRAAAPRPPALPDHHSPADTRLHGSLSEEAEQHELAAAAPPLADAAAAAEQKARIFLFATRFVTVDNVVTWYTTSTNESTTVSFSLACTAAGQNLLTRRCVSP
ncbi:uncharacterized protein LOC122368670 [Amphibalanus amphitrite]|uniref:uncharacterized protein LOC122368670 n=1 Tax=Amphibalanus amphitrite TaxID=1232801 RepID=UPI001C904C60|nr:uncharacterized protein LOC122368670 [Amphibalanus amphitrite]